MHLTPAVARVPRRRPARRLGIEVDLTDMDETLRRLGPAAKIIENTVRNSTTPTVLTAGYKVNVIPGVASALVDTRVLPGTEEELLAGGGPAVGPGVRREFVQRQPPGTGAGASHRGSTRWPRRCAPSTRRRSWSRSAWAAAPTRRRSPGWGSTATASPRCRCRRASTSDHMAHGVDERVPVEGLRFGVNVLDRFLSTC